MKYLLNGEDIKDVFYGRIIYNENEIVLKDFDTNGYEYVDLGLPSGNLWATCNVGANNPEETGLYFQWGDIQGYTAEQVGIDKQFNTDWADYKYSHEGATETSPQLTKYCNSRSSGYNNFTDTLSILELSDDAVHMNMGGGWTMPSKEDYEELIKETNVFLVLSDGTEIKGDNTEWKWGSESLGDQTIKGIKFIKKDDTSNCIFINTNAVCLDGASINHFMGIDGVVMTKTLGGRDSTVFFGFAFNSSIYIVADNDLYRRWGFPVRGVLKRK